MRKDDDADRYSDLSVGIYFKRFDLYGDVAGTMRS